MAQSEALGERFPAVTLAVVSASVVIYFIPQLTDLFIYDRNHVLGGQLWRLLTAPFVHFSASHLLWNLLVIAAAGSVIELNGYRRFGFLCILSIVAPGVLFLMTKPDMSQYGGLSALAVGATAYLCLCRVQQTHRGRVLWIGILGLLVVKILVECIIDAPIFARSGSLPFRVLPSAHIVGIAAAVIARASERITIQKCHDLRRSNSHISIGKKEVPIKTIQSVVSEANSG